MFVINLFDLTIKPVIMYATPHSLSHKAGYSSTVSLALLIMRLIMGIAFILHGWGKIPHPASWAPPGGPVTIPAFFQVLAAISEFGGGIALVLGIVTRLAAAAIGITMAVAVYFHAVLLKDPFVNMTGGSSFEPALVYLGVAIVLLATGAGRYSLDHVIFHRRGLS